MVLILSVLAVFALLIISEWWWRKNRKQEELTRKFIHITVGSFVAFWPYFLTLNQIKILSIAFIVVVLISKYFNLFQAIHSVQRPTNGELWFAAAVAILAFTIENPHIFTAALLIMAIADGFAAIFGLRYGKSNSYMVFNMKNSYIGSATFLLVAYSILLVYWSTTSQPYPAIHLLPVAVIAMVLENFGYKGLDNLIVPLFVAFTLSILI